jgi:hypothetical protein
MEKIPFQHLEAAVDLRSVMSTRKSSLTTALERKVGGAAMMMQMPRTW